MNQKHIYVIITIPLLLVVILRFGLGIDGLYGQDSYEYLRYSVALKEYFKNGIHPGDYFWPVNYPLAGALLSFIIPNVGFCLQIISVLSLSFVLIYIIKTGRLIFPKLQTNVIAISVLILTPFMIRYGLSVMSDMFVLSLIIGGTYHIIKFSLVNKITRLIIGVLLFSIAVMSRYSAIVIVTPILIYAFTIIFKHKTKWYCLLFVLIISSIPIIPHLLIRGSQSANFVSHEWIKTWSPQNFMSTKSESVDGIVNYRLPNIVYALLGLFHPRYLFIAGILIVAGIRKFYIKKESSILGISLLAYLIFLAGINYQNNRFLLLGLPFTFLFFYPSIEYVFSLLKKRFFFVSVTIMFAVQIILSVMSFKVVWERSQLEREIYEYVSSSKPAIYTMDVDISISGRGYPSPIYNIWKDYYSAPDTNAIVIFNTKTFPVQWVNKKPMQNWDHFNNDFGLTEIHSFNSEWKVYEFK